MVRVLRPFSFLFGLAFLALAAGWVVLPQLVNYPAPFLQWMGPVSVVRQSYGPVRMFEGNTWKLVSEGQGLRGARAFSVGSGGSAVFEIPGRGFVKVEEHSLVTLEDSNAGFQVRVVKGSADVRASVPGALTLERRSGQRPPIVRAAPTEVMPQIPAAAPPTVQAVAPPTRQAPVRSVAKERPVKFKQILKQKQKPVRRTASAKPARIPKTAPAPAAPAMVPQILPIQVE